jgi:hypothetical protein
MRIEADGLRRRGVAFIFETIIFETTEGDGLNMRRND